MKSTKAKSQTAEPERFEDTSLSLEIEHSIGRGKVENHSFPLFIILSMD